MDNSNGEFASKSSERTPLTCYEKVEGVVVVISAFICNVLVHSVIVSLHLYFADLNTEYPDSRELITIITFLPAAVYGLIGLVTGMFVNRFGVRATAMVGIMEVIVGLGVSVIAPNLQFLMFSLGILTGKGCSFVYFSVNVALFTYFPNAGRQLVALVSAGEGVCFLVAFPVISYFIKIYQWRNSLLLLCGIEMHCIPFGLIYSMKPRTKRSCPHTTSNEPVRTAIRTSSFSRDNTKSVTNHEHLADKTFENKTFENTESGEVNNCDNDPTPDKQTHIAIDECQIAEEKPKKKRGENLKSWKRLLKNKMYLSCLVTVVLFLSTSQVMVTFLPDFCIQHGLSLSDGAWNSAISSTGDTTARLLGSWLLHSKMFSSVTIISTAIIMSGAVMAVFTVVNSLTFITLTSFFFMLTNGLSYSQYSVVFLDLVDINDYPQALGVSETFAGIGIILLGYLLNLLTEYNNLNYDYSVSLLSALTIVAALPTLIIYLCISRKRKIATLEHDQNNPDMQTFKKVTI